MGREFVGEAAVADHLRLVIEGLEEEVGLGVVLRVHYLKLKSYLADVHQVGVGEVDSRDGVSVSVVLAGGLLIVRNGEAGFRIAVDRKTGLN